jgi:ABC-type multidrug transport system ATPase subunit
MDTVTTVQSAKATSPGPSQADAAIDVRRVRRRFGETEALRDVSLSVRPGEIHALLGPNGAGKTTLLRILTGLVEPTEGEILINGIPVDRLSFRAFRKMFGLVPSGDRSFYLRISGLENLVFFARLNGLRKAMAFRRAWQCLADVGLAEAAKRPVGVYSHGMQKRLSMARALLTDPPLLFVDEATHDLDPEGARRVQDLVTAAAERGTAVLWTTQRLEEIRGFAHRVTLLDRGQVRFTGTVPQFISTCVVRQYVLLLRNGIAGPSDLLAGARAALGALGAISVSDSSDDEHFLISLQDEVSLGEALQALMNGGIEVLACREERSGIELAFLRLTGEGNR